MTGTKYGMKEAQFWAFHDLLVELKATELNHGDCVGADAQAHEIAQHLNLRIVIHPPENPKYRAFCEGAHFMLPEGEYMARNRTIVDASQFMIGTPRSEKEELRSGTWACLRYARKSDTPFIIILPDGSHKYEF